MKRTNQSGTVQDIIREYLVDCRARGLSDRTVAGYGYELTRMIGESASISNDACRDAVVALRGTCRSLNSINHYVRCLKTFIQWAEDNGYCNGVSVDTVRGQKPKMKLYSDEELNLLLTIDRKKSSFVEHRTFILICIALSTGARAETLRNIKLDDIDFGGRYILFSHLKNKTTFYAPMSSQLEKEIREYLRCWKREKNDSYLLCEWDESQASYNALRLSFERYCADRGVKCQGLHALRHTFASNYIKNGGSLPYLSRLLTHSSINITAQYVHLFDADLKKDIDSLSALDRIAKRKIKRI